MGPPGSSCTWRDLGGATRERPGSGGEQAARARLADAVREPAAPATAIIPPSPRRSAPCRARRAGRPTWLATHDATASVAAPPSHPRGGGRRCQGRCSIHARLLVGPRATSLAALCYPLARTANMYLVTVGAQVHLRPGHEATERGRGMGQGCPSSDPRAERDNPCAETRTADTVATPRILGRELGWPAFRSRSATGKLAAWSQSRPVMADERASAPGRVLPDERVRGQEVLGEGLLHPALGIGSSCGPGNPPLPKTQLR
jgi:hypothetical protein